MTKQVMCGKVAIGGGAPISIQSMCTVKTTDIGAVIAQIEALCKAGCDMVRLAVPNMEAAAAFSDIKENLAKRNIDIPLVADIHFDYRLVLAAIEHGADKIRINPGNIGESSKIKAVVDAARQHKIPIRVGVNSGSLEKEILAKEGGVTAKGLFESAVLAAQQLERYDFDDIVVSIKASDTKLNFDACRLLAEKVNYPMHIGVTEAGTLARGQVKSAVGIGALLLSGIGDTIRVSLTADPVQEVIFAKEILSAAGISRGGIEIISCPTCGRTRIGLEKIVNELDDAMKPLDEVFQKKGRKLKIAVMGCAVNGPGEAVAADFGVAGGDGNAVLFAGGKIIKSIPECEIKETMLQMAEEAIRGDKQ